MSATSPNIVVIVLDDLGFAELGCYGSEIATPSIDGLAKGGLRYNNFHVTPLCAPTRACLLTGRNHHAVGMGFLSDLPSGFPGYTGRIPKSAGTLPRHLRDAGYSTFAVGKWHLTPRMEEGPAGPFNRWPLGMGFERFYGFIHGNTDQWAPELVSDNMFVEPPQSPEDGYHLTEDLTSQAIRLVQDQQQADPRKPFFLYFAPGAMHSPHQVAQPWIDPYSNRFDDGWEAVRSERFTRQQEQGIVPRSTTLTQRPSWVEPWDRLSSDERRLFARQMEVYAGFLTHADAQIGRLVEFLAIVGILDNTLVMVLSDNGAAGGSPHGLFNTFAPLNDVESMVSRIDELGGFQSYNIYASGWAWAGNTPFRLWKHYTLLGGVRVPLIIHWPAGIDVAGNGQVRPQFCHAIDLMPTILESTGTKAPDVLDGVTQESIDGQSIFPTFESPTCPSSRDTQYFEMAGSRAIYHDGWKATTDHVVDIDDPIEGSRDFDTDRWSLFCLENDFSEAYDLAESLPERLRKMIDLWWLEAGRNQVLPLMDEFLRPAAEEQPPFQATYAVRNRYVCLPGGGPIETPSPFAAGFHLTAEIEVLADREVAGVICAQHLRLSGSYSHAVWACYVLAGNLVVTFNVGGTPRQMVACRVIQAGFHRVGITLVPYSKHGAGNLSITIDDQEVGDDTIATEPPLLLGRHFPGTLLVGRDLGFPVCNDYRSPFPFTGLIRHVIFEVPDN